MEKNIWRPETKIGSFRSLFFNKEFIIFDESSSNLDLNNKLAF